MTKSFTYDTILVVCKNTSSVILVFYQGKNIPKLEPGHFRSKFGVEFESGLLQPVYSGDFHILNRPNFGRFRRKNDQKKTLKYLEIPTRYRVKHLKSEIYVDFR